MSTSYTQGYGAGIVRVIATGHGAPSIMKHIVENGEEREESKVESPVPAGALVAFVSPGQRESTSTECTTIQKKKRISYSFQTKTKHTCCEFRL